MDLSETRTPVLLLQASYFGAVICAMKDYGRNYGECANVLKQINAEIENRKKIQRESRKSQEL